MGIFSTRRRVARTRSGRYELNLPSQERALVANLVAQLRDVTAASTDDPSVRRLFPTPSPQDPARARQYQPLVPTTLLERHPHPPPPGEHTPTPTQGDQET